MAALVMPVCGLRACLPTPLDATCLILCSSCLVPHGVPRILAIMLKGRQIRPGLSGVSSLQPLCRGSDKSARTRSGLPIGRTRARLVHVFRNARMRRWGVLIPCFAIVHGS
ncbi:hypothetical protein LX32DRAFT_638745 [Colletotrichum zoysiae]|uniref:Uncharacterized protein n=1 Tax=Colletotrichum zoysiae TaxID=1216348 RepID=A0AAD9M5K6_9PEZI|nr:hypothetical protein LX32DRAFT_638745 [Colletotrichum zoysiae]